MEIFFTFFLPNFKKDKFLDFQKTKNDVMYSDYCTMRIMITVLFIWRSKVENA